MAGRDRSKVIRQTGFRWDGVEPLAYKEPAADAFRGVTRQAILGRRDDESSLSFETRYFEIEPGGWSSLERHGHPHAVVVVRGRGSVVLGDADHEIAPLDCVFVAPQEVHQFRADRGETLGFLCVVDRDRDRPRAVTAPEAASRRSR